MAGTARKHIGWSPHPELNRGPRPYQVFCSQRCGTHLGTPSETRQIMVWCAHLAGGSRPRTGLASAPTPTDASVGSDRSAAPSSCVVRAALVMREATRGSVTMRMDVRALGGRDRYPRVCASRPGTAGLLAVGPAGTGRPAGRHRRRRHQADLSAAADRAGGPRHLRSPPAHHRRLRASDQGRLGAAPHPRRRRARIDRASAAADPRSTSRGVRSAHHRRLGPPLHGVRPARSTRRAARHPAAGRPSHPAAAGHPGPAPWTRCRHRRSLAAPAGPSGHRRAARVRHVGDVVEPSRAEAILAACDTILLLPQHVRDAWLVRMARDLRYPHPATLERLQRGQGLAVFADGARVALDVAGFGRDPRLFSGPTRPSGGEVPPREPGGMG